MSTIKYPNGISTINTMQSKSYSSRGMRLENDINDSNKYYRELDKALIYKKPTPVQVVHVDYPKRQRAKITEAYYKRHLQPIIMVYIEVNILILKQRKPKTKRVSHSL